MGLNKVSGILGIIGGIISLIAAFLPAAYSTASYSYGDYSGSAIALYWFFGYFYVAFEASGGGQSVSETASGFNFDILGIICGVLLITNGALAIGLGVKVKKETMSPKTVGTTLLLLGIASIVCIILWIIFVPDLRIKIWGTTVKVKFWTFFENIGPGVLVGLIGGGIISVAGILALIS